MGLRLVLLTVQGPVVLLLLEGHQHQQHALPRSIALILLHAKRLFVLVACVAIQLCSSACHLLCATELVIV